MADTILNLDDSNKWVQFYNETIDATPDNSLQGYVPIPNIEIPYILDRFILAIGAVSSTSKSNWYLGYNLLMIINIAGVGNTSVSSIPIRLGINLIQLPVITEEYTLLVKVPRWHRNMTLTMWKYTELVVQEVGIPQDIQTKIVDIGKGVELLTKWGT